MRARFSLRSVAVALGMCLGIVAVLGATSVDAAAPTVIFGAATNPTYTTVDVTGEIDAEGESTEWSFQVSSDGGASWNGVGGQNVNGISEGTDPEAIAATIEGLRAGVTYEVRLAGFRNFGTEEYESATSAFTTETLPAQTVSIDPIVGQSATTVEFSGHINPNAPSGNPAASRVHWRFHCEPISCPDAEAEGEVAAGPSTVDVHAVAADLEPNIAYEVSLITTNNGGGEVTGGPVSFTTSPVKPSVETIPAFLPAGGTTAQLGGRVDPRNSSATYWVEWGPTATYGHSTSRTADAGSGGSPIIRTQEVRGLTPGTTYHYRIVAQNSVPDEAFGEDRTFTTPRANLGPGLDGCSNEAFRIGPSAPLPDCRAYELASLPDVGGPSTRATLFLTPEQPWSQVAAGGDAVLWETDAVIPGTASAGVGTLMLARRGPEGWTNEYAGMPYPEFSGFSELAYGSPDLRRLVFRREDNVLHQKNLYVREPSGAIQQITKGSLGHIGGSAHTVSLWASRDATRVAFNYDAVLEPDSGPAAVYSRSGDTTTSISFDYRAHPPGDLFEPVAYGTSDDGRMVAFGTRGYGILLRDDFNRTVPVAEAPPGEEGGVDFDALSSDGQTTIYSSRYAQTGDDVDGATDVYAFDLATETTTRVSAPSGAPSSGAGNSDSCPSSWSGTCNAEFVAASPDGGQVYFVSPEKLDGQSGISGAPNFYVWQAGTTRYITTLDPSDPELNTLDSSRGVRFTPDGSGLVFQSSGRVTAYANEGDPELYEVDPGAILGISCVSCRPDGLPALQGTSLVSVNGKPEDSWQPPVTNDDGSLVYLQSSESFLPRDTNGREDVYEFDVETGEMSLISTGTGDDDTSLWGVGGDGNDVFIQSNQRLNAEERSAGARKIWDARVGGGFPASIKTTGSACRGDQCHGTPTSTNGSTRTGTSGSISDGNAKQGRAKCTGKQVRRRGRCVARKHRRHRPHHRSVHDHHGKKKSGKGRAGR